jgi:hypothetical protein
MSYPPNSKSVRKTTLYTTDIWCIASSWAKNLLPRSYIILLLITSGVISLLVTSLLVPPWLEASSENYMPLSSKNIHSKSYPYIYPYPVKPYHTWYYLIIIQIILKHPSRNLLRQIIIVQQRHICRKKIKRKIRRKIIYKP